MNFEIHVEDRSAKVALTLLLPKIVSTDHSYIIRSYKGLGTLPRGPISPHDVAFETLLDNVPRILRAHQATYKKESWHNRPFVFFILDIDRGCKHIRRMELLACSLASGYSANTFFIIAVEEIEAWYLGDLQAIKSAYPNSIQSKLDNYTNDSICNTWELLADAIHPGGSKRLIESGWQSSGKLKSEWASKIVPLMDIENNRSPSFCYFRDKLRSLLSTR